MSIWHLKERNALPVLPEGEVCYNSCGSLPRDARTVEYSRTAMSYTLDRPHSTFIRYRKTCLTENNFKMHCLARYVCLCVVLCSGITTALPPPLVVGYAMPFFATHQLQVISIGEELKRRGYRFVMLLSDCDASFHESIGSTTQVKVVRYPMAGGMNTTTHSHSQCSSQKEALMQTFSEKWPASDMLYLTREMLIPNCKTLLKSSLQTLKDQNPKILLADVSDQCSGLLAEALHPISRVDLAPSTLLDPLLASRYHFAAPPRKLPVYGTGFSQKQLESSLICRTINRIAWLGAPIVDAALEWYFSSHVQKELDVAFPLDHRQRRKRSAKNRAQLLLVNIDTALEYPRDQPLPAYVQPVGPLLINNKPHPLQPPYSDFLKNNNSDVILVSFGSAFENAITEEERHLIEQAIAEYTPGMKVLWKRKAMWLPQNDVLASGVVRVFITHAGCNSFSEAAYWGVPLIAIPIAADQIENAKKAEHHNFGITVERKELRKGPDALKLALAAVLKNSAFISAAEEMAAKLRRHNRTGVERAADYIQNKVLLPKDSVL